MPVALKKPASIEVWFVALQVRVFMLFLRLTYVACQLESTVAIRQNGSPRFNNQARVTAAHGWGRAWRLQKYYLSGATYHRAAKPAKIRVLALPFSSWLGEFLTRRG